VPLLWAPLLPAIAHLSGAGVDEDFRFQAELGATWRITLEPDKPMNLKAKSAPQSVHIHQ
jgi:hypothetical protein